MLLAQGAVTLIGGVVSIYAIRSLSTRSWSQFSTATALVVVGTVFCAPGVAALALRELTATPQRRAEIVGASLRAVAGTFCIAAAAMVGATTLLGYSRPIIYLVVIMAPLLAVEPTLAIVAAAFNAQSQLTWVAALQVARTVAYGALVVLAVATSQGAAGIAAATVASGTLAAILALSLLQKRLAFRVRVVGRLGSSRSVLRAALPIAGISFVGVVYDRIDVVLLSVLGASNKVAFYTVPYGFVRLSWLVPSIISAAFFPLLSRRLRSDRAQAERLFFLVVRLFLFLSLPISLALALGSRTLLPFVYGHSYEHAATVLQIMAWTSVFGFQNYILWYGLLLAHQERRAFAIQLAGLAVNIGLNAFAIPLYGADGAAAALVVSDLFVVGGQAILVHRKLFAVPLVSVLAKPFGASVVVVPPALLVARHSPMGGALAGSAAYAGVLLILRYVTSEEWEPLVSFARSKWPTLGGRWRS